MSSQQPLRESSPAIETSEPVRFVTAASLFDGHDASINMFRRMLQSAGAEVVHLGHNRSVEDVALAAIQEDVQGVALSSYQGGHMEYFQYLRQRLNEMGGDHIRIFGGGGGVIVQEEIQELHSSGITRIFSPEDGRTMGLEGIIDFMMDEASLARETSHPNAFPLLSLARQISLLESEKEGAPRAIRNIPVLGITGPGGSGKSSLTDELSLRILNQNPNLKLAVLAVDPTRKKTGGALLGDRIRMNSLSSFPDRLYFRSLATRGQSAAELKERVHGIQILLQQAGYDLVILETPGTGQEDSFITELSDRSLYVMTSEYGAPSQLEKIAMLDYADLVALNKAEKTGADDALRYIQKQFARNRNLFDAKPEDLPVFATVAGRFNDAGVHRLYNGICAAFPNSDLEQLQSAEASEISVNIIPRDRANYLSEIAHAVQSYRQKAQKQTELADSIQSLEKSVNALDVRSGDIAEGLQKRAAELKEELDHHLLEFLQDYPELKKAYESETYTYKVRNKEITQRIQHTSLSGLQIPRVALPSTQNWSELSRFYYLENLPGNYPFTAGVFPFRKQDEDPTRMFAGEGGPERTNQRFHYLCSRDQADSEHRVARLSTAFDSVTLYGEDPDRRPDIYGKIGNSGVSIPTLDDCKRLYSGFDLSSPLTSVSMTINGPAPAILAMFFNTAIDQNVEKYLRSDGKLNDALETIRRNWEDRGLPSPQYEADLPGGHDASGLLLGIAGNELVEPEVYERIKIDTLQNVRGTVQADILKEDQAQNTCIFSTGFALKMMGDVQEYFTENGVRNFYSVSISGYHMAEAGANPVTQLAFTLANGFTYLEYYLARGLDIDAFASNFSFFFSNGLDPEYSVIGRVARRIWAIALKEKYGASERAQKLKYHIQTSGRSLHAREIHFNDIRTTLQAMYALFDNTNSLHTNAYDEAITTPTEASVRRAVAIQLIIQKELGLNQNQNPWQGSYIIEKLTDMVEAAVLEEFHRLSERGGVIGAMETMYQRSRIQDESMEYEKRKHSGDIPVIGVNTFTSENDPETVTELIRSTDEEKDTCIQRLERFHRYHQADAEKALKRLKQKATTGGNLFEELLETVKVASLGQISQAL
ncbi:MAG: cobalamin-dependent protein, partial [Leptospiraceae bacterium]|nr:cobalamin-dependent protein [Leptospiraceae bacterium]